MKYIQLKSLMPGFCFHMKQKGGTICYGSHMRDRQFLPVSSSFLESRHHCHTTAEHFSDCEHDSCGNPQLLDTVS